jgi:glyoxylase-like metal-dependent hydrolase (beta-lactamase superfamily II)
MFATLVLAAAAVSAPVQPSDGYFYETIKVSPHVHVIMRPDPVRVPAEGNVTVIEQADGLIVVDAGGSPVGGVRVVERIKALSPKPVKFVVYTHWHGDHNLGAPAFRAAYPNVHFVATQGTYRAMIGPASKYYDDYVKNWPPVVAPALAHANDPSLPTAERARWAQLAVDAPLIGQAFVGARVVAPDIAFSGKMFFEDADTPAEVMFLGRGNTDGDAVAWLPKERVLITGDLVVAPYPFGTESYPSEWIEVLKKLESFDFKTLVPGHGALQADHTYVDSVIALIDDVRRQVEPLAKQGLSLEEIQKKVDFGREYDRYAGKDTFVRKFFKKYFMDPMIGCAYKEAKGEPIVQAGG